MTCPRCGHDVPATATECPACRTGLAAEGATMTGFGGATGRRTSTGAGRTMTGGASAPGATGPYAGGPSVRLAPGTLLGTRYEILAVLGEGGMGTVYKARDLELGRLVALKVIRPEMASRPEVLERFKREILLASQVTHKNVLRIHDLGEADDVRFISMSYIEGPNLKTLLEKDGPLPLERGLALARQIGEALVAAHDAGIVHRDLKPQNVLVDADGNAYIADFGISRSLAEGGTMTETGTVLGTVDYMSPEQARGETPDHRGDIYSFGVMLYEMFTGALPFRASNALSVMMKRLHEDAPSMRQARPELPAWLSAIVGRALQRAPEDRYQSAGDLLRDLERQRASRSWRRFARPRYLVPAAAVVVALVLVYLPVRVPWPPWGPAAPVAPRTSLVLLGFQNATGDARYNWVRTGLPSLIRSELIETKALRLVGEERAREIFAALKISDDSVPSPGTIKRIADLLGAENVLSGRLLKMADRLRIDASLQAAGALAPSDGGTAGSAGATSIVVDGEGDRAVFAMVDDLTRQVRDHLGVAGGLLERRRGATDLSTHSVEALSLYGDALALSRSGKDLDAETRLEQALTKDPQFHAAQALLAEIYDRNGRSDQAIAEANKAIVGIGSASPFEAARVRAVQARLTGKTQDALKAYQEICDIAPNNAEAFLDLAAAQEDSGDLDGSLKSLQRVLTLDPKHARAHYMLGRVRFKLGEPDKALDDFKAALDLHTETNNQEAMATVLNGIGNTYRTLGQPEQAIKNYQSALDIRRRIDDKRGVAVTLYNVAMVQRDLGRHDEGIRSAKEALAISQEIGDRERLAIGYSDLGDIYQTAGRPELALQAYQDSLKIVREIDDPASLSRSLANVGYIDAVLGRYPEGFILLKEALAKRREIGDKTEIVRSLMDIGIVDQIQGRYEEAVKYETEGLTLAHETGDKLHILVLSANLSNVHEDQGEYGTALQLLADAQKLAKEINDKSQESACLIYLGSVRRHLGDVAGAETALRDGLQLARELKNAPLLAEGLANQAALFLERDQRARAQQASKEAVARAREAGDQRLILLTRLRAGEATGSVSELSDVADKAAGLGLAPIAAVARLALAQAHLASGRARESAAEAQRAQKEADRMHLRDVQFAASHLAARAMNAQGQAASAAEQFSAGLGHLEEMRRGLTGDDLRLFLARQATQGFVKEAQAAFQNANRSAEAGRLRALLTP